MTEIDEAQVLIDRAQAWISADPDPETVAELQKLVETGNTSELNERFSGSLGFGTAGLRAVVGAGPARMNRAVVIRATRAVAEYLLAKKSDARTLPIVVGFDGRLSSRAFAEDTAGVLAAAKIPVRFFSAPVPTPLVAYAARQLAANAAVVITASHNPPEYNGYKVYDTNGAQIVSPVDEDIAARIEKLGPANQVPRIAEAFRSGVDPLIEPVPVNLFDRYLMEIQAWRPAVRADRSLRIIYTPMHGVGWRFAERALHAAGYANVEVVPEQAQPDGRFPTVRFPNPEEPGALDLALALAERTRADLILANDPDADRLAVCVPTASGSWQQLTGNQVGLLLADFLLESAAAKPTPLVVSSIVSSPMLADIARARGARFEQVLTGFKWIYNCALDLERDAGVRFITGYEEALGYSVGQIVRDKDGISAAVLFTDLVAHCRAMGSSVLERLEALYRQHGLWVSVQKSIVLPGAEGQAQMAEAIERLGARPPESLAGRAVTGFLDYRRGAESRPRWLGATNLLALGLERGGRVLVRPSGTEPKLKLYVDLGVSVAPSESVSEHYEPARAEAERIAEAVQNSLGLSAAGQ
jgi:phosphomannomutase